MSNTTNCQNCGDTCKACTVCRDRYPKYQRHSMQQVGKELAFRGYPYAEIDAGEDPQFPPVFEAKSVETVKK